MGDREEHQSEPLAGLEVDRILQAGEGGLAGKIRIGGEPPAGQLEERITAPTVGVVLYPQAIWKTR